MPAETYTDKFAESELLRLEEKCKSGEGREMQHFVTESVMELANAFARQGHSGFSASYCLDLFFRLAKHKPATALTGEDDEWTDIGGGEQQNRRCPSVFRKTGDNSTVHDLDAVCFSDNGGHTWFGNAALRKLYEPKIAFPYYPPARPRSVYVKWLDEKQEDFSDITDNEDEKKRLYEEYERKLESEARDA
jgi:hypothetical protein